MDEYTVKCLLSMFVCQGIIIGGICIIDYIPAIWCDIITCVYRGIQIGVVSMLLTMAICIFKYRPNEKLSEKRFQKTFVEADNNMRVNYFCSVKYGLCRTKGGCFYEIYR